MASLKDGSSPAATSALGECYKPLTKNDSALGLLFAMLFDAVLLNLSMFITFYVRYSGRIPLVNFQAWANVMLVVTLLGLLTFYFMELYELRRRTTWFDVLYRSVKAVVVMTLLLTAYAFYSYTFALPRLVIFLSVFGNTLTAAGWRMVLLYISRRRLGPPRALIVGCGPEGQQIKRDMELYSAKDYEIVGYADDCHPAEDVLGKISDLRKLVTKNKIDLVILTTQDLDISRALGLIWLCDDLDVDIAILPNLYEIVIGHVELKQIAGIPLLEVDFGSHDRWYLFAKRLMDFCISAVSLVVGLLFLPFIALAIKLESRGPIFYTQERLGRFGRPYRVIKFRSMVRDAEKGIGPTLWSESDPRVTRVGAFLRRYHVDELPQLLNVLKGDMSLVGPRPERENFVSEYVKAFPAYKKRFLVKPGITGLAQVHGRYDTSVEHKIRYDLVYIRNMSLILDFKILLLTLYIALFPWRSHRI
jgi:exopolysaccharide biosynthesis polyprenyl glycosylphosphotransferase